jgi:hypothetical protein
MKKINAPILASGIILFGGLLFIGAMLIAKYFGVEVMAEIVQLPVKCNRHSSIIVEYEHQRYSIGISAASCREGVYETGQRVQLIYHKGFNTMMIPGMVPEFIALVTLVIANFLYFQYRWEKHRYR